MPLYKTTQSILYYTNERAVLPPTMQATYKRLLNKVLYFEYVIKFIDNFLTLLGIITSEKYRQNTWCDKNNQRADIFFHHCFQRLFIPLYKAAIAIHIQY